MNIIAKLITMTLLAVSAGAQADNSLLNCSAKVTDFENIRYRGPVVDNDSLPIVLFHGIYGGASHRTWRQLLPLLDQAQKRVYIMDLPGVGDSDKPKRPYSIEDIDQFVINFLQDVVKEPAIVVSESLLSASALKVLGDRPDLIRRAVLLNPSGLKSLNEPPTEREQALYDRLFANETAASQFYSQLLNDNSLRFFLSFAFSNDELVNDSLLDDFRPLKDNDAQKYLTLSFVGGQLWRPFAESAKTVFKPVLAIFGADYEQFQDNEIATAAEFEQVRPDFTYVEIPNSGSLVQREQPELVAEQILMFSERD